ncbi:MAG: type II toxin-antitoxin system RelB/DinJ family antitoxin [Clostridia bacterium]|nr:type II toxin-antitoxin system RelB/DinJ family antitoxin [Clostridia bacterium]
MAQTTVNIRMDEETKKAFDLFCQEIGLSVSAAFNIFAKTVVREQRIPFELTTEVPNAETVAALNEYYEMKAHPERYKRYSDFKALMDEVLDET